MLIYQAPLWRHYLLLASISQEISEGAVVMLYCALPAQAAIS